jgi:hypothetical protein
LSRGGEQPATIDFTAFILSLSQAALQQLGQAEPGPGQSEPAVNLALAQQTIDILAMLQAKTAGNRSEQEDKLLGNILYDLRMRYVEASRGAGQ